MSKASTNLLQGALSFERWKNLKKLFLSQEYFLVWHGSNGQNRVAAQRFEAIVLQPSEQQRNLRAFAFLLKPDI